MQAESNFDYTPILRKTYIDPIRTVTVIDDEYPTLDQLLKEEANSLKPDDKERLAEIVEVSRKPEFNWLLDVYDGKENNNITDTIATRLHHSDLLILDYHLDGEDDCHCEKSLNIIKSLSQNRHFNIVAVHTKGYDGEKGTVEDVLVDIIISLQEYPKFLFINNKEFKNIEDELDNWQIDSDEIIEELINSISKIDLLKLAKTEKGKILSENFTHTHWLRFIDLFDSKPDDIEINKAQLIKWLFKKKFESQIELFAKHTAAHFDWGRNENGNWVKSEDLFLTVLSKREAPVEDIPEHLLAALGEWKPHPHKVILTKLRAEVEANGISASSNILNKKYLQAAWLKQLLEESNDDHEIKTTSWSIVSKLWEELANEIKPNMDTFTLNLVSELKKLSNAADEFVEDETSDENFKRVIHANCFACSRKITKHHLVTGHILKVDQSYLLCLSPICDLVPGQKSQSQLMPITLVTLHNAREAIKSTRNKMATELGVDIDELSNEQMEEKIVNLSTSNNLIFFKPSSADHNIEILSFTVGSDGKANPKSKEYYVDNQGRFSEPDNKINIHSAVPTEDKTTGNSSLNLKEQEAQVVGELRYEYALNLLQRLGLAKTRIGLDFIK